MQNTAAINTRAYDVHAHVYKLVQQECGVQSRAVTCDEQIVEIDESSESLAHRFGHG